MKNVKSETPIVKVRSGLIKPPTAIAKPNVGKPGPKGK